MGNNGSGILLSLSLGQPGEVGRTVVFRGRSASERFTVADHGAQDVQQPSVHRRVGPGFADAPNEPLADRLLLDIRAAERQRGPMPRQRTRRTCRRFFVGISFATIVAAGVPADDEKKMHDSPPAAKMDNGKYEARGGQACVTLSADGAIVGATLGDKKIDTNGDGAITAEEITQRIKTWQASKTGLIRFLI